MQNIQKQFLDKAYCRLGIPETEWQPSLGFRANKHILNRLYYYYQTIYRAYSNCWSLIASYEYDDICRGNRMLLENEQYNTIQHHYEMIRKDRYSNRFFRFTRFVMRNIHPHHRRFIADFPLGDVTRFSDRWRWISHPKGMWPSWINFGQAERDRLVDLSNEDVISHNWQARHGRS